MRENALKRKLAAGETVIGSIVYIPSARLAEIVSLIGFDFIVIDMEHGPIDIGVAEDMVRAAELNGATPIVRITHNSPHLTLRALRPRAFRRQAVVGMLGPPGGGDQPKLEDQPHAKQIAHAPQPPMWSPDTQGEPCAVAPGDLPNGCCRGYGGLSPGAPKGNKNAFKHGRYSAEALARRREVAVLIRTMKGLTAAVDADG